MDDTEPLSDHTLLPSDPDGDHGWYINDVEVTIEATDPAISSKVPGSGVAEIKYKIGDGYWQTITGDMGYFIIDVDDENLEIQYYAVDEVGNEEGTNSFIIDMDQTVPEVEVVSWESYRKGLGWYVRFVCDAIDVTSGMDRVEMYINEGICEVITGSGPIYEFEVEWSSILHDVLFTFKYYDIARNMIANELYGSDVESYVNSNWQQLPYLYQDVNYYPETKKKII